MTKKMESAQVTDIADKDGMIKGRAADGTQIKGKIAGKSLASQIRERNAKKREAEEKQKQQEKTSRRRRRRGQA